MAVIAVLPYYYISRIVDNIFYYFIVIALYSILYSFLIRGLLWAATCLFADEVNCYIYLITHPGVINLLLSYGFFIYLLRYPASLSTQKTTITENNTKESLR